MATVTLYKDSFPWIEIPEWLDGQDRILLHVRQMSMLAGPGIKPEHAQMLIDACREMT